ncbi:MAG: amino acid ABC transporter permease [Bacillota bacterium]
MEFQFRWDFVIDILPRLVKAAGVTIQLTVISITLGIAIGLVISLMRMSGRRPLKWFAVAYVEFLRGTPLLVQIMIIHTAIPVMLGYSPIAFISAIIALGVNSGAYVAEIFRAGIQAVDRGQMEAARSLGMTWGQAMQYVVLPQAFKISIPPLGNEFIALLKDSSLVLIIGVLELMGQGRLIIGARPRPVETWFAVALLYLVMTRSISMLVNYAERRLKTGDRSERPV